MVALVWAVRRLADALPAEESVLVRAEVDEPSSPVSAPATAAACGPARNSPRANAAAPVRAALFFLRDAEARERVDLLRAAIFLDLPAAAGLRGWVSRSMRFDGDEESTNEENKTEFCFVSTPPPQPDAVE